MKDQELGGDPPCWAHMFSDDPDGVEGEAPGSDPLVVDLDAVGSGTGGAVWSLPHGGDLDANLIRLDSLGEIGAHVNNEVDVLMVVRSGGGTVTIDSERVPISSGHLAWIPRGSNRSIAAGNDGISYLSVHRRRGPLTIAQR